MITSANRRSEWAAVMRAMMIKIKEDRGGLTSDRALAFHAAKETDRLLAEGPEIVGGPDKMEALIASESSRRFI